MNRNITVSTEVFAGIWSKRAAGEDTEDAILRRLLGVAKPREERPTAADTAGGVFDTRNGVQFPEGFEIFRNYKRREYFATARAGSWVRRDTGQHYPTLNQLNASIAAGAENVWNGNWKYRAPDGTIRSIAELRR